MKQNLHEKRSLNLKGISKLLQVLFSSFNFFWQVAKLIQHPLRKRIASSSSNFRPITKQDRNTSTGSQVKQVNSKSVKTKSLAMFLGLGPTRFCSL